RCCSAYGLVRDHEVQSLSLVLGSDPQSRPGYDYDKAILEHLAFGSHDGNDKPELDEQGNLVDDLQGPEANSIWEDAEYLKKLPRPQRREDCDLLQMQIDRAVHPSLLLSPEQKGEAESAVRSLFDNGIAQRELQALYNAYHTGLGL
ncbi:unnamed protein product, partial [Polarella glacialis]